VTVEATIANVPTNTAFSVFVNSGLQTGNRLANFPVGNSSNDSIFEWNMTITAS